MVNQQIVRRVFFSGYGKIVCGGMESIPYSWSIYPKYTLSRVMQKRWRLCRYETSEKHRSEDCHSGSNAESDQR